MEKIFGFGYPSKGIGYQAISKLHKAASVGNVSRVQHLLLLREHGVNDVDWKCRTALHFACACGQPEVVTLLLERKCDINAHDADKCTPLIMAVQSQQEECATILLENGADPNAKDVSGNTALHYAASHKSKSIAAKLLSHNADIEAKNEQGLTPLLFAIKKNKPQMVEFLVHKKANIHAADNLGRTALMLGLRCESKIISLLHERDKQIILECTKEIPENSPNSNPEAVLKETSEKGQRIESIENDQPQIDQEVNWRDSQEASQQPRPKEAKSNLEQPESKTLTGGRTFHGLNTDMLETDRVYSFAQSFSSSVEPKNVPKENLRKSWESSQQHRPNDAKPSLGKPELQSLFCSRPCHSPKAAVAETLPTTSARAQHFPPPSASWPDSKVKEKRKKHKNNEMEASENLSDGAADTDSDGDGLSQQRKSGNADRQLFSLDNEEHDASIHALHMEEVNSESEKWTSSKEPVITQMSEMDDSPPGHLLRVDGGGDVRGTDEDGARPTKKESNEKNKVKKQINAMDDLNDLCQSSETVSENCDLPYPTSENILLLIEQLRKECKDSVSLLKILDIIHSYKRLIEFKKSHCELLKEKLKKMENKVSELCKELSETKEVKSQLEHDKVEWEGERWNLRFALKQEKEKRQNVDHFYEKIKLQLIKNEERYNQEVEMKQQLEISLRTVDLELKTVRSNLNQVVEERNDIRRQLAQEQNTRILQEEIPANHLSKRKEIEMAQENMSSEISIRHEKEKYLLHKNHMLQDEITMIRLEIDTMKDQNQEKERKYFEHLEIAGERNDDLQKTIKLNEETFSKTILQYNGQLSVLTAENMMLNSKLENEKQNKERLEAEVESYCSRLAAAVRDYDQSQASIRDLELALQRARDECFHLQDKMNCYVSNLKDNNGVLSQQLSKAERKCNSLEVELHHTKDALREKTSVLEQVQRDLSQTQCQMKEMECLYQNEQDKVCEYIRKQESIEERLYQLQSGNTLLQQQLYDAHSEAGKKEKTVTDIQDQFHDIVKKLQAESKKQSLMLEDRNKDLISECNHLKERLYQHENSKIEREFVNISGEMKS